MLLNQGIEMRTAKPTILTYCPLPYNGKGPSRSCVNILQNFPDTLVTSELVIPRVTDQIPAHIGAVQTLSEPLRRVPWWMVSAVGRRSLDEYFARSIDAADPRTTVAYFWPDPPTELLLQARARGILTVREMINCYRGTAKAILDAAYRRLGLEPNHTISNKTVELERRQLSLYDFVFASSQVEPTLIEAGVDPSRILPTSFGWTPSRFFDEGEPAAERELSKPDSAGLDFLFVGTVSVRKGAPQLLEAWRKSGVKGKLLIAGSVDREMKPLIKPYLDDTSIEFLGFKGRVADLYHRSDVFVFPTYEEGGPQVVYEAAGCGLPIITTPMGSGRIVKDRSNGLIVEAGDVDGLAEALTILASSADLRRSLGRQGAKDATKFTYERIGRERALMFLDILQRRTPGVK